VCVGGVKEGFGLDESSRYEKREESNRVPDQFGRGGRFSGDYLR
jgi:hypothetical protein